MTFVPTVTKSKATEAYSYYRQGYSAAVIGELMGWHRQKANRITRLYEKFGGEIFADG